MKTRVLAETIVALASDGIGYNDELRERITDLQSEWFRQFAYAVGLPEGSFTIRVNRWADTSVTLHAENVRIQFSSCFCSPGLGLMVSKCASRRDHGLDDTEWIPLEQFRSSTISQMIETIRVKCGITQWRRRPFAIAS